MESVQYSDDRLLYGRRPDQGCQFTGLLKDHSIQFSMDGQGCWRDNVFLERLWKSVKYEEVYLHVHECISEARTD